MYIFVFIYLQNQRFIKKERIFGLDLLRAIAITSVLLSHTTSFLQPLAKVRFLGAAVGGFLQFCRPLGQLGVELFFVLSGFLIGTIFLKAFINSPHFGIKEVRTFLVRRWFRTLPSYWLILTVNIVLYQYIHPSHFDFSKLLYYIFAQNLWYPHPPSFFCEAWSLAVEEWFYLLFPVGLYLSYRWLKPVKKRVFFLKTLVTFLAVFIILRILNAMYPMYHASQDAGIRKVVLLRLDALGYGVLVAYFVHFKKSSIHQTKEKLFGIGIAGMLLMYYLIAEDGLDICNATQPIIRFLSNAFLYLLMPIIFAMLLPYANSVATTSYIRFKNGVQFISKISYSLYLVHFSLIYVPFFDHWKIGNPLLLCAAYLGYWMITILLSYIIYRYFEVPMMNKRERY